VFEEEKEKIKWENTMATIHESIVKNQALGSHCSSIREETHWLQRVCNVKYKESLDKYMAWLVAKGFS
jgi:hypothetical protein